MKISIERAALLKAVSQAQSVVERRNTIPILANVLIEAEDAQVSFRATDLDVEVVDRAPAMVERAQGPRPCRRCCCMKSCASCPTAPWSRWSMTAALAGCRSRRGGPALRWPRCRKKISRSWRPANTPPISRPRQGIAPPVRQVEIRHLDRGNALLPERGLSACVEGEGGRVLRCVATDGHRLARIDSDLPIRCRSHARRDRAAQDRRRIAQAAGRGRHADRGVGVGNENPLCDARHHADLEGDRRHVPRLHARHPVGNTKRLEVDAGDFAKAVDRVATVSSERSRAVKLALEDDKLVLSVNAPDAAPPRRN